MQSGEIQATPAPSTTLESCDPQAVFSKQVEEAEQLVNEFRKLLVKFESPLGEEGVREQLETLERWSESFRRGMKAAAKMSAVAPQWLKEVQDKLKLAADELQRMDSESPSTATDSTQSKKAEEYMRATQRIDKLIPAIDHALVQAASNENLLKEAFHEAV